MRRRMCLMSIVWLLLAGNLLAQASGPDTVWTRRYGGTQAERGFSIVHTTDGGYAVTGFTSSFGAGNHDIYVVKLDGNGDTLWTWIDGLANDDEGRDIIESSDGSYLVTGFTATVTAEWRRQAYIAKLTPNGDAVWTKAYGGEEHEYGRCIREIPGGGFIVVGYTNSFGAGNTDVYLLRLDSSGDTIWTRTYGGTANDLGNSIQVCSSGGYVITGNTESFGAGESDVWLVRTDEDGDTLWTRAFGGPEDDEGRFVTETSDGGFIVSGYKSCGPDSGRRQIYLVKVAENGDLEWEKTYGGDNNDVGFCVKESFDEKFVVVGTVDSGSWAGDLYIMETDLQGNAFQDASFGAGNSESGFSVQQMPDSSYIIGGYTKSFGAGQGDIWVVRTVPSEPDWAWMSEDSTGFPLGNKVFYEQWSHSRLHVILRNHTEPATEIISAISYDPVLFRLDTAYLDTAEFPQWSAWSDQSYVSDSIHDGVGRILVYLSNGGTAGDALQEGIHRLATFEFTAIGRGSFRVDTCVYPSLLHGFSYEGTSGSVYEPRWPGLSVRSYYPYTEIALSSDSFLFEISDQASLDSTLYVLNTGDSIRLQVDSIVKDIDWLLLNKSTLRVNPLDSASVKFMAHGAGLSPGEYRDSVLLYTTDPDDSTVVFPVILRKDTTDDAWLSLDPSGSPPLVQSIAVYGETLDLHFMLRNSSDSAHAIQIPVRYDSEVLELLIVGFDSSTFPSPPDWTFELADTVVDDTGKISFHAWTDSYPYGIPPNTSGRRIGRAAFLVTSLGRYTRIDTCAYGSVGRLSYTHGPTGMEYDPFWQKAGIYSVGTCGDVNGNSTVTSADGFYILNYFGSGPSPVSCWAANVDGDNQLDVPDGFYLLNYFGVGPDLDCQICGYFMKQRKGFYSE